MSMGIIAGVATVAGGIYSYRQQRKGARQAEENSEFDAQLALRDAEAQHREDREQLRRMRMRGVRLKSEQRARIAASGVTASGSPLEAMAETAGALEIEEQQFARLSRARLARGKTESRRILEGGRSDASSIRSGATAGLIGSASAGFGQLSQTSLFRGRN